MPRYRWGCVGLCLLLLPACADGAGPDDGEAASVEVAPAVDTLRALQDTAQLAATVRDRAGRVLSHAHPAWSSLDPEVATVDSLGRAVARAPGTARVVASLQGLADTARVSVVAALGAGDPDFVRVAADAPPLTTRDTSFWAVRGEGRELEIYFRGDLPGETGDLFLEFRVPGDGLLRDGAGHEFERGDSVRIEVQVDESGRFLFRFEPSGLEFDPEHPAELRVRYQHASSEDRGQDDSFFLWKQEDPDSPWLRIATVRVKDQAELRAEITGFTAFCVAVP